MIVKLIDKNNMVIGGCHLVLYNYPVDVGCSGCELNRVGLDCSFAHRKSSSIFKIVKG